ncbi:MAG: alpha-glucosidase C-terminal domain-containing protein [Gammaproteobacteria bacterium]|nr:alpha-glucosidase C-terminal domain-containing protein [Gammaproteobacteria bacterium]
MLPDFYSLDEFNQKLTRHLAHIYPDADIESLASACVEAIGERMYLDCPPPLSLWSQQDIMLITYGDTLREIGKKPLDILHNFLHERLQYVFTAVHVLPFFPYSSDDGFAVKDYMSVNPELGTWEDIRNIAENFRLMADLVINHCSSQHQWFKNFQYAKEPGKNYFIEADPNQDLSSVVRPRSSPLLRPLETAEGDKFIWCTFSDDQVDLDFSNTEVLLEFLRIIAFYLEEGVQWIRLDAVAYLWKIIGTSCIHLEQTHEIIKLLRLLTEYKNPFAILITETNVPHSENLSYFGNYNEAHVIYNFSLPPLVLHALMSGNAKYLKKWMMSMPPPPTGCCYLNFTASHDGIGLRPAEGLLSEIELNSLLDTMKAFGGRISSRSNNVTGKESPYEINISLFDAMKGTYRGTDQLQIERFICSQVIMMSVEGIPAFYIHSMLATPNNFDTLEATHQNRSINRYHWDLQEINYLLDKPDSTNSRVFKELCRLIRIRRRQPAFHPNATQFALQLKPEMFGFWRQSIKRDQSIFCINNLSDLPQELELSDLNLISIDKWRDLISGEELSDIFTTYTLQPYQCLWISNNIF